MGNCVEPCLSDQESDDDRDEESDRYSVHSDDTNYDALPDAPEPGIWDCCYGERTKGEKLIPGQPRLPRYAERQVCALCHQHGMVIRNLHCADHAPILCVVCSAQVTKGLKSCPLCLKRHV